jgi:D-alanine--poly(phosphoribitol) ligase subunit 1
VIDGTVRGLIGFVAASNLQPQQILAGLKQRLPAYSVPSRILALEQMPLNQNGKVDRGALVRLLEGGALNTAGR